MIRDALRALLAPRTFRIVGGGAALKRAIKHDRICTRRKGGPVDVAWVGAGRRPPGATSLLFADAGARLHPDAAPILIGADGGLCAAGLSYALRAGIKRPTGRPVILLSDGLAMAQHLLDLASDRGLPIHLALALGQAPFRTPWTALIEGVAALPRRPLLILALQQAPELAAVVSASSVDVQTLLLSPTPTVVAPRRPTFPSESIAAALGWPTFETAGALIEAAGLIRRCVEVGDGRPLLLLARSDDEAALLDAHRRRAAFAAAPMPATWRRLHGARRIGQVVVIPSDVAPPPPSGVTLLLSSRFSAGERPHRLVIRRDQKNHLSDLFAGVAGLWSAAAAAEMRPSDTRPPALSPAADRALDRPILDAVALRNFFSAQDLPTTPLRLVGSASAAGDAAKALGLPVELRLSLRGELPSAPRIRAESAAAARQAFRDLIARCAEATPPPVVEGLIVAPVRHREVDLEMAILRFEDRILLRVNLSRAADRPIYAALPLCTARSRKIARELLGSAAVKRSSVIELARALRNVARAVEAAPAIGWLELAFALDAEEGVRMLNGRGELLRPPPPTLRPT